MTDKTDTTPHCYVVTTGTPGYARQTYHAVFGDLRAAVTAATDINDPTEEVTVWRCSLADGSVAENILRMPPVEREARRG